MATLSPGQIAGYARQAGFTGPALVTAVAVALAESGGKTDAVHRNGPTSFDYGLWQINTHAHPWILGQQWDDPAVNAAAAYRVYTESKGSFSPWTTFKSGAAGKQQLAAASGVANLVPADHAPSTNDPIPHGGPLHDATASVGDAVKLAAQAGVWLSNPHNWLRVVYVAGGAVLIVAGISLTVTGKALPAVSKLKGAIPL